MAEVRAQRLVRTFAFLDLCGFTDFADGHGDEAAVAELVRLRSLVREIASLFGVRVGKWLGDGVMLVGVEAEPVVDAVAAVLDRWRRTSGLALRAGLASGPVLILDGDDYVGRAVNVAARLCEKAQPDQILVATDGLAIPDWMTMGPPQSVTLKGFGESIEAGTLRAGA